MVRQTEDCDTDRKIVALGCCYWHCIGSPWLSVKTLLYYYSEMVRQTEGCDTAPKHTRIECGVVAKCLLAGVSSLHSVHLDSPLDDRGGPQQRELATRTPCRAQGRDLDLTCCRNVEVHGWAETRGPAQDVA
ncbi:hypothetical protein RRG08_061132 [Elysia crispata]|uniref:Uncharacterized protein n=1 Tax=Elysia crispata TaxID=231223 RepID=A0AAE0XDC0_9GAST|nr:hypothetical protein RRG08_061132 [Elysia crispata]